MKKRILVIASGGGHWTELMQLRPAFADCDTSYVCIKAMYRQDVAGHRFYTVPEVSRLHWWNLPLTVFALLMVLVRERPQVVVTTGSAPGMLALRLAKLFGARTVWVDSIANVDEMSMSGCRARRYADLWLTQWPHLAKPTGPAYFGSLL